VAQFGEIPEIVISHQVTVQVIQIPGNISCNIRVINISSGEKGQKGDNIIAFSRYENISRSSLHRKIKTETKQSSTEFIRDVRLKYAIRLMNDDVYNMDEIAVLTGFNSTSWFNRSFKQKYGKTPKEYNNDLKNR
jgi:AraC-like DNA-binding protein